VPLEGPVILVVNHPNGLIDPLFLLCLLPRPVSFLAKAPLFDMPVIGWFVRALGSIPVYRQQDEGFDRTNNRRTFERARAILAAGGVIALFPEGASHGDPRMRPIKTGAARIALGAAAWGGHHTPLTIAPVGIYYTAKGIFRSSALLYFGEPLSVAPFPLEADGEPPANEVRALTGRIENALRDVTLQADEHEALNLVARAEQLFSSDETVPAERLVHQFELRRRFLAAYSTLRASMPEQLASLSARIARYEAELRQAGLDPDTLQRQGLATRQSVFLLTRNLIYFIVALPIAIVGTIINYPAYRLVGFIATGLFRGDDDIVGTIKVLAGALLFPVTWIALAIAVSVWRGTVLGFVALILGALTGYASLLFFERLEHFIRGTRALMMSRFQKWGYVALLAERRAIHEEIVRLADELDA